MTVYFVLSWVYAYLGTYCEPSLRFLHINEEFIDFISLLKISSIHQTLCYHNLLQNIFLTP